jgi:hypothetical protein
MSSAYCGWTPRAVDHCRIWGINIARSLNATCLVLGQTMQPVDRPTASSFGTTPARVRSRSDATGPASIGQSTRQIHISSESIRKRQIEAHRLFSVASRNFSSGGTSRRLATIGSRDRSSVYAMTDLGFEVSDIRPSESAACV